MLAVVQDLAGDLRLWVEQAHDGQADVMDLPQPDSPTRPMVWRGRTTKLHVVDDVHIAVARELDAKVLHLEDGRHVGVRREAVGALAPRLVRSSARRFLSVLGLGGVGQTSGRRRYVSASRSLVSRSESAALTGALGAAAMCVGHALGKDVQAQNGDHDGEAREERLPPTTGQHAGTCVGEDIAPRGRGLGDAGR